MNETGQSDFCFPIDRFEVDIIKERFQELWADKERISAQLEQCIPAYRLKLDEQYETIRDKFIAGKQLIVGEPFMANNAI